MHEQTKSVRLIAVCKRTISAGFQSIPRDSEDKDKDSHLGW